MHNRKRGREDKKRFLLKYQELIQDVEREAELAGYWNEKAHSISASSLGNFGIRSSRPLSNADYLIKFYEIAENCSKHGEEAARRKDLIIAAINKIPEQDLRILLKLKYIDNKSFLEIAETLHYSMNWIWQLHGRALDLLKIPTEEKDEI